MKVGKNIIAITLGSLALFMSGCKEKNEVNNENIRQKITFMLINATGSPMTGEKAEEVLNIVQEYTGVDVKFEFVPHDSYDEKQGLVLASPDTMPMLMHVNKLSAGIVDAAEAGAFWDLNDFIWDSEKYPNLSKANKEICESLTVNKKLIGLYKARDLGRYGIGYRTDWAEKLGLGEPKTIEDVYNMLKAFRYGDPDGNGKDDTYGLAMCRYTGPLDIIQTWFGCGNGWVEKDGDLVPIHETKEYKDALVWMKKIYDEGFIVSDWAVRDTTTWRDQVKKGESGMFVDVLDSSRRIWDYFEQNNIPSVVDQTKNASMKLIGTINGRTLATPGYNGFFVITKAAKTKAQVEACLRFLDKMCDDKMIALASYGIEGYSYNIDADGFVEIFTDANVGKSYSALTQALCFIPNTLDKVKPLKKMTERKLKEIEVIANNEKYAVINPALSYLINSSTYAFNGAYLDQILSDARTQYICNRIDDEGLQKAFDIWEKVGADVKKEVNEQYHANKK